MEKELKKKYLVGPHKAYWVARLAAKGKTHLISDLPDSVARELLTVPVKNIEEALDIGFACYGEKPKICIMPVCQPNTSDSS